jgi:carboxymethylenebutenolidase
VSYYGARNTGYLDAPLQAPVMFHFGKKDRSIPAEAITKQRRQWPDMDIFTYASAGHAFNRNVPGDRHYDQASAKLAWERTLAFFKQNLGA